ncbi:hypothetical protein T484DRAFT_1642873, partial [Baffinella frigidus]
HTKECVRDTEECVRHTKECVRHSEVCAGHSREDLLGVSPHMKRLFLCWTH